MMLLLRWSQSLFTFTANNTHRSIAEYILPSPIQVRALMDAVEHSRNPLAHRIFPDLIPVNPQPDRGLVTLLALPAWPYIGVPVFIQVIGPAARRFALFVPGMLTRSDILLLARCDEEARCHVHLVDTPWPLPETDAFPVRAGDLVTVRPWNVAIPAMVPLAVLLTMPPAWDWPYQTPAFWNAGTWLVTDQRSFHVSLAPPPNPVVHRDVASALSVSPADLHVHYASPTIRDHDDRGHTSTVVVLAADKYPEWLALPQAETPYILDLRPILLPLTLARATEGVVDIEQLYNRIRPHCAPGFCIRIIGGMYDEAAANHYRQILPGMVIRVELHPQMPEAVLPSPMGGSQVPPEDPGWTDPRDTDNASASHLSSSTSSGPQPDTGGTGRPSATHSQSRSLNDQRTADIARGLNRPASLRRGEDRQGVFVVGISRAIFMVLAGFSPYLCHLCCLESAVVILAAAACRDRLRQHQQVRVIWLALALMCLSPTAQAVQMPPYQKSPALHGSTMLELSHDRLGATTIPPLRPVPTPCRSRVHISSNNPWTQIVRGFEESLASLQTLLDECNARTQHHFFLAATLLDTLTDHFATSAPRSTSSITVSRKGD